MLGSEVRGCGRHNVRRQAGDWLNMWSKSKSSQTQSPKLGQSPVRDQKRVTSRVRESSPGAGEVKAMSQKLQTESNLGDAILQRSEEQRPSLGLKTNRASHGVTS